MEPSNQKSEKNNEKNDSESNFGPLSISFIDNDTDESVKDDYHLRPPIPTDHCYKDFNHLTSSLYHTVVHPLLCRMYVASNAMKLGSETQFTAMVLFHRYVAHYHYHHQLCPPTSNINNNHTNSKKRKLPIKTIVQEEHFYHLGTVAASCLFLGCKVEEEPRRIRDVMNMCHMLDFTGKYQHQQQSVGKEKSTLKDNHWKVVNIFEAEEPPLLDELYWETKHAFVQTEQHILRMLKFDSVVSHPHRAILLLILQLQLQLHLDNKNKNKIQKDSFKLLNNCLFYPPALQVPVLPLACAAIALAIENQTKLKTTPKDIQTNDIEKENSVNINENTHANTSTHETMTSLVNLSSQKWWIQFSNVSDEDFFAAKIKINKAEQILLNIE